MALLLCLSFQRTVLPLCSFSKLKKLWRFAKKVNEVWPGKSNFVSWFQEVYLDHSTKNMVREEKIPGTGVLSICEEVKHCSASRQQKTPAFLIFGLFQLFTLTFFFFEDLNSHFCIFSWHWRFQDNSSSKLHPSHILNFYPNTQTYLSQNINFHFQDICLTLLAFTLIQLFQYWRPQKSTKTLCGPCKWTAQGVDSTRAHQQIIIMPGKTKLSGWCDVSLYHK